MVKNPPAMQETMQEVLVQSLSREKSPGGGMAIHSSILAWRIHRQKSLADYTPQGHKE